MTKLVFWLFTATAVLLPVQNSFSVEVLSAEELASHCEVLPETPDSIDGQYCIRYIQGFIDGALATDVRVMVNIEAQSKSTESIAARAIRTRLPSRSESQRAAGYAEFCLGDPLPLEAVVTNVVNDLNARIETKKSSISARDAVYESLRKNYPCNIDR